MDLFDWESHDLADARRATGMSEKPNSVSHQPNAPVKRCINDTKNAELQNLGQEPIECEACDALLLSTTEYRRHLQTHGHICLQCFASFTSHELLGNHAGETGHEAYKCLTCDAKFSRRDVMLRHRLQHSAPSKKWSCHMCKKWRAPNGFARKDHLIQHQRNYHHIEDETSATRTVSYFKTPDSIFHAYCYVEGCSKFRSPIDFDERHQLSQAPLFPTRGVFTAHMRLEHDQSIFPCTIAGCKRVNGKGFFRERALMKHMSTQHATKPEADVQEEITAPTQFDNSTIGNFDTIIEDFAAENFAAENFTADNYFAQENFSTEYTPWN